jgi:hypothetical protein
LSERLPSDQRDPFSQAGEEVACCYLALDLVVTSQFLGKEFIKIAHEIMHHFMHFSTLHFAHFSKFCLVLKPKSFPILRQQRERFTKIQKLANFKTEVL